MKQTAMVTGDSDHFNFNLNYCLTELQNGGHEIIDIKYACVHIPKDGELFSAIIIYTA
jgi:hypothetical protein